MRNYKIVVFTTEYMAPYLEQALKTPALPGLFQMIRYQPFQKADDIAEMVPKDTDGILASGNLFATSIQQALHGQNCLVQACEIDDAAVHRLLWKLCVCNRHPLERIYVDFLEMLGIPNADFLSRDFEQPLTEQIYAATSYNPAGTLAQNETQQYYRLLELWRSGRFDILVTRYSGLIALLQSQGVQAYYPFPSVNHVRKCCQMLIHALEMRRLQNHQAAAIHINLWFTDPVLTAQSIFEQQRIQLAERVREFLGGSQLACLIHQSHFGIEVITDLRAIQICTKDFTICCLGQYLQSKIPFRVYIGYGLGGNLYQARLNAIRAVHEAEVNGGSFLINEADERISLYKQGETVPPFVTISALLSGKTKLSMETINRVALAIERTPSRQITAPELAEAIGVSVRTANRYLNSMCQAGILHLYSERYGGRGRPARVYGTAKAYL